MIIKPMLSADASTADLSALTYPLLVSPKLDGIRCVIWAGVAYSRNGKPIRNRAVQEWARGLHNLDGELIVGSPNEGNVLSRTQSGVMSFDGNPDFTFHVFDMPMRTTTFDKVTEYLHLWVREREQEAYKRVKHVPHHLVMTHADLLLAEQVFLDDGYEGIMLRSPSGLYKNGRATLREGTLMKLKRFQDGEAVVVRIEEGHVNNNVLERDELGRAKRSKDRAGLAPSGMVGTIIANDPTWGELRIAPGIMTHVEREWFFERQHQIVGHTIHWRSFGYGVQDKPRFPRFYGLREGV